MNVELRKFKSYPRLSQETTAFNADLYVDGVRVGECQNAGHGGPNMVHFFNQAAQVSFEKYVKALPPEQSAYGPLDMTVDLFIGMLVEKEESKTWLAKKLKKAVLFTLPGDEPGCYRTVKLNPTTTRQAVESWVTNKYPKAQLVK